MSEWPTISFGELIQNGALEVGDGYRAKGSELTGGGPLFLRSGQLTPDGFDFDRGDHFDAALRSKVGVKLGRAGDTVVTTKGNSVGRAGFVPSSAPEFVYSPHLSYWRSLDESQIHAGYLRYWVRDEPFREQLRALANGTDMAPYLSLIDQHRLRIKLPPVETQVAIADVLGAIDDKIDANRRIVDGAPRLAMALLQEAALDGTEYRVGDVAEVRRGLSYTGAGLSGEGIPMANLANAAAFGGFKRDGFKFYTADYKPRHVARGGDLLVANTEQTWRYEILGWPMLVPDDVDECLFSHHTTLIDFADAARLRLALWAHLFTAEARGRVEAMAHGTTVAALPLEALLDMTFLAPASEVPAVSVAQGLLHAGWATERESESLGSIRDALLPELMSGRLRVRDAEALVSDAV